jgi:hypothetical protein
MEGAGADDAARRKQRPPTVAARILPIAACVLLGLVVLLLVVASFASYATVKHRLDRYATDHDANFSRQRFRDVVWQLRALAAVAAVVAGAIAFRRRRLAELVDELIRCAYADARAGARSVRRAIASSPAVHLYALLAVVVGGVVIRVAFLFQPMRYDESGTYVHYASEPLYIGLTTYTAPNNHLLNTALIHVTTAVLGNHPWAIRLPAFIAGCALIPATYGLARLVYGTSAALLAAALVATSSTLIEYSTNARGYMGVALVFVLLLALATYLCRNRSPAAWAAFAVLSALGFFTMPTTLYAFGAAVVWLTILIERERRYDLFRSRLLPAILWTAALTTILYAPVAATSGVHAIVRNPFVTPHTWTYFWSHIPDSLASTFARWHRDQPAPLWFALAICFVVGVVLHRRIGRLPVPPAVGPAIFIPPVLVLQHVVPYERVWLFLLPVYFATAAAGVVLVLGALAPRRYAAHAFAVLAVVLCASLAGEAVASRAVSRSEDTSTFRDAPRVARYLEQHTAPGHRVLVSPPADLILEYYLHSAGFDAGRLIYTNPKTGRMLVVVKLGKHDYGLREVLRQHLGPRARRYRPLLLARFPHARVYELVLRGT